jgi:hypothetical protein
VIKKFPETPVVYAPKIVLQIRVYNIALPFKTYFAEELLQCLML